MREGSSIPLYPPSKSPIPVKRAYFPTGHQLVSSNLGYAPAMVEVGCIDALEVVQVKVVASTVVVVRRSVLL